MALNDPPQWVPPVIALVLGPVVVLLLMVASSAPNTWQSVAQAVLAGLMAAGIAVGVTDLGKRAQLRSMQRRGILRRVS